MSANLFTSNLCIKLYPSKFVEIFEAYIKYSRTSMNGHLSATAPQYNSHLCSMATSV